MFEFLRIQFKLGKITEFELLGFIPKWLTREQVNEIMEESK